MYIKKVMPKLGALIVIALLASSGTQTSMAAEASATLSGADVLDQAVALYEKLQETTVAIPEPLAETDLDIQLQKSVVLGYINLDDALTTAQQTEVSKQDVMTILYKTIINYDSSYIISEEEANKILNDCCDNAYINEENRLAYAFMIRQGIISSKGETEPNKPLTWDSCRILVDLIYDYFFQDVTVTINNIPVTIGANIETVLEEMGEPNRIDVTDYGFEWYVYNEDYSKFAMIGVEGDRICAFYTNSSDFAWGGVRSGDSFELAENSEILRFTENNGKIDSISYNPRQAGREYSTDVSITRSKELLDIINAYRAKNELGGYVYNNQLSDTAWLASKDYMNGVESEDAVYGKAYDIFEVYNELVSKKSSILTLEIKKNMAMGVAAPVGSDENIYVSLITDEDIRVNRTVEQVDPKQLPEYTAKETQETEKLFGIIPVAKAEKNTELDSSQQTVENITAPVLKDIAPNEYNKGDDIVIEMEERAADKYHLEVYDIEADSYLVNSYVSTTEKKITIPADGLTEGLDYTVTLSSVTPDGQELPSEEKLISYGSAYKTGVKILTDGEEKYTTDNDYVALQWESDLYNDFYVDVYNSNGELVVNTIIEGEKTALIQGIDPGEYYVYVTALRRGTLVEKSQDMIAVEVKMPQPVVNEYILNQDDKYYFVYEDEALGVIYFYDEEIVQVEENGEIVKKKKIIQKQVKSTKAYRNLAQYRAKPEYTTGDPRPHVMASDKGQAIVDEAKKYLGVPYVWGGTTPDGFDCSGLVQYVCRDLGITVDRVTYDQINNGVSVPRSELAPGDLIFFAKDGDVHHVGIYVGNNEFIHAPRTGDVVKISSLSESYYNEQYYGARRVY